MEPTRFNEPEGLTVGSFSTRLEFDTDRIRNFSENRGIEVLWEKSYLCTCRNRMTVRLTPVVQSAMAEVLHIFLLSEIQ